MVNLHLHTKYSLLDAIIKIDELMDRLVELGQTACAITDHGNMYGAVEFYKSAKAHGIKPIIGCEVYVCGDVTVMKRENKMHHLILLCRNEIGRQNLQKLVTESTKYKFNKRPRIDFEMLKKYHEGLICCSACMVGEVAYALQNDDVELAYDIARKYKELFQDDYYIEYQSHRSPAQQQLNAQLVQLALDLQIKYVVTCDSHYLYKEDQKYHNIFVQVGQSREAGETYDDCFVQSEDEVYQFCQSTIDYNATAIANTHEIAEKCNVDYPLSAPIIPHTNIPAGYNTEEEYLRDLCDKGWKSKGFADWSLDRWKQYMSEDIYDTDGHLVERRDFVSFNSVDEIVQIYKDRLEYEFNAVLKMGFEGYYVLVHSYVSAAYRRGIARGSAGGSLIAYLSGIVDIDPIKYGLYFERFIDVGALDLLADGSITKKELKIPDVDEDFSPTNRDTVMKYIIDTYGSENVVCLGQFQYIWAKGSIKDIGKVLGIPFEITNEMTKKLGDESIDEALELGLLDEYTSKYPDLFVYVSKLAGLPKSYGVHPCGRVISMRDAVFYNALEYNADTNTYSLQGDMHTADDLGLVKIDLLGLRTLDVIYDVLEMIGKDYSFIAPHNIDLCDKEVWKEFANGNSLQIFQFESPGMRNMLKDMQCNSIDDLSAANALYRPGSKDYIPNYINRKKGLEPVTYINQMVEPILKSTYGIIVYQEQLIEIGRLAGLRNPDELRQATAKKKPKLMAKIEPEMKNGLITKGWTQEQVDTLWDDILKFARYSFNKSHSAAYALTAYITMYLKVHYPVEFITASINSYDGKTDKIAEIIAEAKRMGVQYQFDQWQQITPTTICKDNKVYLGANVVKGFGKNISYELQRVAQTNPKNFVDFLLQYNSKDVEKMIKLDWLEAFGESNYLLYIYDKFNILYDKAKGFKKNIKQSKIGLDPQFVVPYCKEYCPSEVKEINMDAFLTEINSLSDDIKADAIDKIESCKKKKKTGEFNGYNYEKLFKILAMPDDIKQKYATKISEAEYKDINAYQLLVNLKYNGSPLSVRLKIQAQNELLSFMNYTDSTADPLMVCVTKLNTTYSPTFTAYRIKDGGTMDFKVHKSRKPRDPYILKSYRDLPFQDGDILYLKKWDHKPRVVKDENAPNGWREIPGEQVWWLIDYTIM